MDQMRLQRLLTPALTIQGMARSQIDPESLPILPLAPHPSLWRIVRKTDAVGRRLSTALDYLFEHAPPTSVAERHRYGRSAAPRIPRICRARRFRLGRLCRRR